MVLLLWGLESRSSSLLLSEGRLRLLLPLLLPSVALAAGCCCCLCCCCLCDGSVLAQMVPQTKSAQAAAAV
jgi:hypothetical protein